jgi:hypothetical protein
MAKLRGGHDNITVLLTMVKGIDEAATLVDPGAAPTQIDAPVPTTAPGVDAAPLTQKSEVTTQPDVIPTSPEGTVRVTERSDVGRSTEPGFQQNPFGTTMPEGQSSGDFEARGDEGGPKGKVLLLLAALFTLLIVGAVILWWVLAALSK